MCLVFGEWCEKRGRWSEETRGSCSEKKRGKRVERMM